MNHNGFFAMLANRKMREAAILIIVVMFAAAAAFAWPEISAPVAGLLANSSQPTPPVASHFASDGARRTLPICGRGWRSNCIVDGDTLWLDDVKIRLEDIDAPEISSPRCPAELALGERAKLRLQALLNAGAFTVAQIGDREHDVYGRQLRTISVGGRSVGQQLVAEGLAHQWVGHKLPWCN